MKKNLLTVLILALLIVNIVLTSVMMISVMGTNSKTADLVNSIATVLNLELTGSRQEEGTVDIPLSDSEDYPLASAMTIPLKSTDGKDHYIIFSIALSMNKKHKDFKTYGATMADRESRIMDTINTVVSSRTVEECRDDFDGMREDILTALQELFQSDFIYKVAISGVSYY